MTDPQTALNQAEPTGRRVRSIRRLDAATVSVYGAIVVSVILLLGYFTCITILLTRKLDLADGADQFLMIMFTTLQTMVVLVPAYWLGSSSGSARKDMPPPPSNP